MKKLTFIIILCLGCFTGLMAQNVWKPFNCNSPFLGADSEGNLFAMAGYSGLLRSQDEGETWEQVNDNYMHQCIAFSPQGRIFVSPASYTYLQYSDDGGDTWQQTTIMSTCAMNDVGGIYAVSNDTVVVWSLNGEMYYTLDGGTTWGFGGIEMDEYHQVGDLIVNEAGDVYVSKWYYSGEDSGIFHSTLSDMQNWELAAFNGAVVLHMEFDPEGNVVAGSYWGGMAGFQHEPGFYLLNGNQFAIADNGIVYSLHNVSSDYNLYMVLNYSGNHGETFYDYGEALPIQQFPPGGEGDGYLYKGHDGHLYFYGHNDYKKSIFNTNDIHYIEGEVVVLPDAFAFGNYPYGAGQAIRVDDDHIYPVTVDGFRPDPTDLSRLIVHYDTIPMGATIGAFGTIREMHDYVGDSQNVLDIQQTTAHYYDAITSFVMPSENNVAQITRLTPPYETYLLRVNNENLAYPLVFNGTEIGANRYTFIGHLGWPQQYVPGMELQDIQPFDDFTFELYGGTLTTDFWAPPCLSCPCEEDENQHFLTSLGPGDYIIPYYPMHNGRLFKETFINNDIFREGMHVDLKGISHIRYDMTGDEVNVVELVEMDTDEEATLTGTIVDAPMPHTGFIPLPGMELAFMANGRRYYLENEQDYDGGQWILVGNDTIYTGQEITATFTTKMMLDFNQNFYYRINITQAEPYVEIFPRGTEWYYEIKHLNGDVTYQHLEYAADTAINSRRAKIIVETNTMYDKSESINHEYIYEDGDQIYWWNKDLEDFTLLYDFGADVGDEWEINGGWFTITVHVDAAHTVTYKSETYRVLSVSDPSHLFTGDIICGIGHTKSFFPETPIAKDYEVDGLRCYWQDGDLVLHLGEEDCDAIYYEIHGVDENVVSEFTVYPNPSSGLLFVIPSPPNTVITNNVITNYNYRITNLLGQTLKSGLITADHQQIDARNLPNGMYYLTIGNQTQKIVINHFP